MRTCAAQADRDHKKILLGWQYNGIGVDKYVVYRAVNDNAGFVNCATLSGDKTGYEDKDLHISNTYRYKVKAVLKNGIESMFTNEIRVSY